MKVHNGGMEYDASQRREALKRFMHSTGLLTSPWEKEAGLGSGTLRKFLKDPPEGAASKTLTDKTYDALARAAARLLDKEVTVSQLQGLAPISAYLDGPKMNITRIDDGPAGNQIAEWPLTVPVYGSVSGAAGGLQMGENRAINWVRRPPRFEVRRGSLKDIFAVQVDDLSMIPRHKLDSLLYVDPTRQPSSGDDVVIEIIDEHKQTGAFLREFVERLEDGAIKIKQLNPLLTYDVPAAQVARLFRVMTMRDLFA